MAAPVTYEQAGRGLSSATADTHKYAKLYFSMYAITKQCDPFDVLIEEDRHDILCDIAFWREFATWLHSHARQISNQQKPVEAKAALAYLSALTTLSTKKWPSHSTWTNSFNTWYQEIRREIEKVIGRREILDGDDGGEESQDIGRALLIEMNEMWNRVGTQDAMIKSCAGTLTWICMGRSGEFAFVSGDTRTLSNLLRLLRNSCPHTLFP